MLFTITSVIGVQHWFRGGIYADLTSAPGVHDFYAGGNQAATVQVVFQIYEIACALAVPRLRGKFGEMYVHHFTTLLLAYLAIHYDAFLYYGVFFLGVTEVSSIPLALVDLFKQFKPLAARYKTTNARAREVFAAFFIVFRTFYWPVVSFYFWRASLKALQEGTAKADWVVYTFLTVNVLLTSLQFFWSKLIFESLLKIARKVPDKDD